MNSSVLRNINLLWRNLCRKLRIFVALSLQTNHYKVFVEILCATKVNQTTEQEKWKRELHTQTEGIAYDCCLVRILNKHNMELKRNVISCFGFNTNVKRTFKYTTMFVVEMIWNASLSVEYHWVCSFWRATGVTRIWNRLTRNINEMQLGSGSIIFVSSAQREREKKLSYEALWNAAYIWNLFVSLLMHYFILSLQRLCVCHLFSANSSNQP